MAVEGSALLEQARAGSVDALGRLFDSYTSYLSILARIQIGRRLSGKVDPADIVQEAFLDATRQFSQFRGVTEVELKQWLRSILAGKLALVLRKFMGQNRDFRLERELKTQLDQSSEALEKAFQASQSTPSKQASRKEQVAILADAITALPPDFREIIILRHVEGIDFAEAAERMGRSRNATNKLWARAIASLRRAMDGDA